MRVSNSLDPDQDQQNVGPDLGPNCLQRLSADDESRRLQENSNCQLKENYFILWRPDVTLLKLAPIYYKCEIKWINKKEKQDINRQCD